MSAMRKILDRMANRLYPRVVRERSVTLPIPAESDTQRLRRLARASLDGQLAAAELELHDWQRHESCPTAAAVLLAALLAKRGDLAHANRVLRRFGRDKTGDADACRLLISVLVKLDLSESASRLVHQLQAGPQSHRDGLKRWLEVMDAPGVAALPTHAQEHIRSLADELIRRPRVVPSLVAAHKIAAQNNAASMDDVSLLRLALEHATRIWANDEEQMLIACQGLAELAMIAGDADDARRWAHRGLRINPYNAVLSLVLSKISDDPAVGPPAAFMLQNAVAAHPRYADLRLALIHRLMANGATDAARAQINDWMIHDPANPHARRLLEEVAA